MEVLYFFEGIRNTVLDGFFSIITVLGEETVFMAVGMIIFWCVDKYQGYYLLCTGFIGTVINQFLKMVFRIPRPWVLDPEFKIVESARKAATGYSFPSGHTQSSVGLFGGIARWNKNRLLRIIAVTLCVLVPLSRMYLGVHTPYDVGVSVIVALILIFALFPIFKKCENNPKLMYAVFGIMTLFVLSFLCFAEFYNFPSDVDVNNYNSALKNAYTLLGCMIGLIVIYTLDIKFIKFETDASFGFQILKAVFGIVLVVLVKELTRSPLESLIGNELIARSVRYFLVVITGGALWPLTFKYLKKVQKNNK